MPAAINFPSYAAGMPTGHSFQKKAAQFACLILLKDTHIMLPNGGQLGSAHEDPPAGTSINLIPETDDLQGFPARRQTSKYPVILI